MSLPKNQELTSDKVALNKIKTALSDNATEIYASLQVLLDRNVPKNEKDAAVKTIANKFTRILQTANLDYLVQKIK